MLVFYTRLLLPEGIRRLLSAGVSVIWCGVGVRLGTRIKGGKEWAGGGGKVWINKALVEKEAERRKS